MTSTRASVITVTPNPSLDLLFEHDRLVWDDANRMDDPRRRPGGQGLNVVRAVRELGGNGLALTLLGGPTGAELSAMLRDEGTRCMAVRASAPEGDTRTFVAVRERSSGRSMLLNARGPRRTAADADALEALLVERIALEQPAWVAGCGSLPAGFPTAFYATLARRAHDGGARFVADCDGDPLRMAHGVGCDLLVPNQHEASRLIGRDVHDVDSAAEAARLLCRGPDAAVAVTLGAAGAVLVTGNGCWHASPPPHDAGSAVGAGDAFLAALLLAIDVIPPPAALARAVAAGTATLRAARTALLDRTDFEELLPHVTVSELP